jgi:predicted amidohydrolase YtcJ
MSIETRKTRVWRGRLACGWLGLAGVVLTAAAVSCVHTERSPGMTKAPRTGPADLVVVNARIWTGVEGQDGDDRGGVEPTALAVVGDEIAALGMDEAVRRWIGPRTEVIDAGARRLIPGITDSHTHIVSGGYQLARLNLRGARDREAFVEAIGSDAKAKKAGQWVLGGRWSVESWTDPTPPNKSWIDPVTGNVPVFLSRMDGHSALANSAALRLGGIDASGPPDPEGGEIERDPDTGEPTGILKESAMGLVSRHIPRPTPDEDYEALRRAMTHANAHGVTSMHNMSTRAEVEVIRRALREGTLTVRITSYLSVSDWASYVDRIPTFGLDSDMARLVGFKGFMDGSLGSRTAYLRSAYSDAPATAPYPRGQLTAMADPIENFRENVALVDAHGLQMAVHSIGDEANHLLLGAYEYARQRNGRRDARHRIEHAQHLHVEDIPRFAALGVVASMQPFHKADDGRYAEDRLGHARLEGSYAYRQLVDSGALVVFGSDWPVVTLDPFAGMDSAVNARILTGEVWLPSHSLTVLEALRAYTVSPPHAIHQEDRLGTIELGKLADFVILTDDLLTVPGKRIGQIKVDMTVVGGEVVYRRAQ